MTSRLRFAITADLHWGIRTRGDEATRLLVAFLEAEPPDVLILAGDVGADEHFEPCLALFDRLSCHKALVPGNHDIWVRSDDARGDSLQVYREGLPRLCAKHGFTYLDQNALILSEADLAIIGSINWYDYSWSLEDLRRLFPAEEHRLQVKRFTQGRHNDANYVRWPLNDISFTTQVVNTLQEHLQQSLSRVGHGLVVTHHPAFHGLSFPRPEPTASLDGLLWDAFSGNKTLEDILTQYANQIPFVFSGHTHRSRENTLGPIRGYNIGGDYHFKRLLLLDWPDGTVEAHQFGNANL